MTLLSNRKPKRGCKMFITIELVENRGLSTSEPELKICTEWPIVIVVWVRILSNSVKLHTSPVRIYLGIIFHCLIKI